MIKKLALIVLLWSFYVQAQDTIQVKIDSYKVYEKVMLYSVVGSSQKYVGAASLENELFKIAIPENSEPGMYRLYFDANNGYFDLLYNNESVAVTFDPSDPEATAVFQQSEENQVYQSYLNQIGEQQFKADSIQYANFAPLKDSTLIDAYPKELQKLYELQNSFEISATDKLAYHFIKSNEKYYSPELIESPEVYLTVLKEHFFDYIDFSNQTLLKSSFFVDRSVEYMFYMNGSDDVETDVRLKKEAIDFIMLKAANNYKSKSEILSSLIYAFAGQQQIELTNYVRETYYNKLPEQHQEKKFLKTIDRVLETAIGVLAPEITWQVEGETKSLYDLDNAQNYVIIFWSTTCSHCLVEIPKLYEFMNGLENVHVIAVALEENDKGYNEHIKTLDKWTNVLGLNKWENEFAQSYQILSTPTYFVLDSNKKILLKPEELEGVIQFFRGY
ncbi:MAG: TlpA family protein disulfide reductase [Urechidicola sp.]|nr:TlpA family protein disulfide reductase [Urechidicola sp.]